METKREHLWRDKPIFSANEMVEFAKSISVKIMSNVGAYDVTVDDLGEWVKKRRMKRKQQTPSA